MLKACGKRIAERSTLVHGGEKGRNAVIDALALKNEIHASAETNGMKDEDNPLGEINDLHDKMDKVEWFLEMEFSKKIRIKYRDRFGKIEK